MIRLIAYVWLGLVLGVSFLATPIKFRAESLTLPVALDVGSTTFHAFGRLEWLLSIIAGETLPKSHLHSVYAGAEFAKALALLFLGLWTAGHTGS